MIGTQLRYLAPSENTDTNPRATEPLKHH